MSDFTNSKTLDGLTVKLWRGERMVLIGMDVDDPEPDFVGFSIEVQSPNSKGFQPLVTSAPLRARMLDDPRLRNYSD